MSVFVDSSALVKLYVDEADEEVVSAPVALSVAAIARVEVPSALWRKTRLGQLSSESAGTLVNMFEADFFGTGDASPRFAVTAMANSVLDRAARLTAARALRAYDAVQLASALAVRDATGEHVSFACFDDDLRVAASAEGFILLP